MTLSNGVVFKLLYFQQLFTHFIYRILTCNTVQKIMHKRTFLLYFNEKYCIDDFIKNKSYKYFGQDQTFQKKFIIIINK